MISRCCYRAGVAVGSLSRRDCLKLLLAANAAWLGSLALGTWTAAWPSRQALGKAVPIEGLGLGIRFTNFLRGAGITTIRSLVDALDGANSESRALLASDIELARMLRFGPAQQEITARLAAFAMFGPVPFETLTRQETDTLRLVAQGHSDKQIAKALGVTEQAVEMDLASLYRKLQDRCAPYDA